MSRGLDTGKSHQNAAAGWACVRLRSGKFLSEGDQDGVLFCDGVGMGKTWEALATAARLLESMRRKRHRGRVLIICPPNLVSKWEDELAAGGELRKVLDRWARTRCFAPWALKTLSFVVPIRRSDHVKTSRRYGRFHATSGTYLVSHNLLLTKGRGVAALIRAKWDVIIVDEAHHPRARKALEEVERHGRCTRKLLLSATPFQLEPREWSSLSSRILRHGTNPFAQPAVREFINAVDARFHSTDEPGPSARQREGASELLRRIASRSRQPKSPRSYSVLAPSGRVISLERSIDRLDEGGVATLLGSLEPTERSQSEEDFEIAYLRLRLRLASRGDLDERTFVATELRRFVARGTSDAPSPRLEALTAWAAAAWANDLERAFEIGVPLKTIVFTSWVRGHADVLKERLGQAFDKAVEVVRRRRRDWGRCRATGRKRFLEEADDLAATAAGAAVAVQRAVRKAADDLRALAEDEVATALAGAHDGYLRRLLADLRRSIAAADEARTAGEADEDRRGSLRQARDALESVFVLPPRPNHGWVARYTGDEARTERDRVSTAFRRLTPPWVLVASNVGAEGIDLHTYTRRIVHYDLEWNPAKMEQREGRADRVGRRLREPLDILYCLVPRTYDERMFHQLVARDRWHGVLLGKAASRLAKDDGAQGDARIEADAALRRMTLDLSPRG